MSIDDDIDPKDVEKIKNELKKEDAYLPCNIWGFLKEVLEKRNEMIELLNDHEKRIKILEGITGVSKI